MIKEIEVEVFLKPVGLGISRPSLVRGDDFKEYILKNQKVDDDGKIIDYNCMFLNEMLAYQIGVYLDVPMPQAVIAHVDEDFIKEDRALRFAYRVEEGNYFASQKLDELENNLKDNVYELMQMGKNYSNRTWNTFFKNVDNKDKIVNIIAFDILIANFDRYANGGNILISGEGGRNIFAIDHGHAFYGPIYNKEKINALVNNFRFDKYETSFAGTIKQSAGNVFRALSQHIDLTELSNNPFIQVIQKIEDISKELINEWLNNIPIEWYIDKEIQTEYYKNFIIIQKEYVKGILDNMAKLELFENYLGGDLIWKIKEKSSTVS